MNKRKMSSKVGMIICFVVGLCLIFTGIYIPKTLKKRTFEYSEDFDFAKVSYEFEIDTKDKLDINTGKVKIKIKGTDTKTFNIYFDSEDSDIHENEYSFVVDLFNENASLFNEIIKIEIYDNSGNLLTFKPETMSSNFSLIPMTIVPIFAGVVFLIVGVLLIASKSAKVEVEESVQTITEKIEQVIVKEEDKTVTCKYCGLENDRSNAKCEYCGGPLYRGK